MRSINTTQDDFTGNNCSGVHCSLREAIIIANFRPGLDSIFFDIPDGGPYTIRPTTSLPAITDPVVIDGYTQPGTSPATAMAAAELLIELDGIAIDLWGTPGLHITAGNSTVRGLVINNFRGAGILLETNGANLVQGCYIGTDVSGMWSGGRGNSNGLAIMNSNDNIVGGNTPEARNLVSLTFNCCSILLNGADGNLIQGNFIGTGINGVPLPNGTHGILLNNGSDNNTIGGSEPGEGNTIAFNEGYGILVNPRYIVPDIEVSVGNSFQGNSIFANDSAGIDIDRNINPLILIDAFDTDDGSNGQQNFPELDLAIAGLPIVGSLHSKAGSAFRLDFYANSACDGTEYGEGEFYLGTMDATTDPTSGDVDFATPFSPSAAPGQQITATATGADGTSEFSKCVELLPDADGDGIADAIDASPPSTTIDFSDGTTTGSILDRGGQILMLSDASDPAIGVRVLAAPTGGGEAATVFSACDDTGLFSLGPGDEVLVTCSSVIAKVISGTVELLLTADDGRQASVELAEDNGLVFKPESFAITAPKTNADAIVILIEGGEISLEPGASGRGVALDIKPGSAPNVINPKSKEVIPVAILSDESFDATSIDPASVEFGLDGAAEAHGKGHFEDADGDGDVDLVLHFRTQESGIQSGDTQVRLSGSTFAGEAIAGVDAIETKGARSKPIAATPISYDVSPNFPNPFNLSTQIAYQLPEAGEVSLVVYNMLGQPVRKLVRGFREVGYYQATWDGRDDRGQVVGNGVYLYRFVSNGLSQTRRMLLLK